MAFSQIAWGLLKIGVYILGMTIFVSFLSLFPYFMNMSQLSNDILLRTSINNYVLETQVEELIQTNFGKGVTNTMTYKNEGETVLDAVKVEVKKQGTSTDLIVKDKGNNTLKNFDPKADVDDMLYLKNRHGSINRGDPVEVTVESEMLFLVQFWGQRFTVPVTLKASKYGVAMQYYRYGGA